MILREQFVYLLFLNKSEFFSDDSEGAIYLFTIFEYVLMSFLREQLYGKRSVLL